VFNPEAFWRYQDPCVSSPHLKDTVCHFLSVRLSHGTLPDSVIDDDPLSLRLRQQLVQCSCQMHRSREGDFASKRGNFTFSGIALYINVLQTIY
jgi:hypothetical protein